MEQPAADLIIFRTTLGTQHVFYNLNSNGRLEGDVMSFFERACSCCHQTDSKKNRAKNPCWLISENNLKLHKQEKHKRIIGDYWAGHFRDGELKGAIKYEDYPPMRNFRMATDLIEFYKFVHGMSDRIDICIRLQHKHAFPF